MPVGSKSTLFMRIFLRMLQKIHIVSGLTFRPILAVNVADYNLASSFQSTPCYCVAQHHAGGALAAAQPAALLGLKAPLMAARVDCT